MKIMIFVIYVFSSSFKGLNDESADKKNNEDHCYAIRDKNNNVVKRLKCVMNPTIQYYLDKKPFKYPLSQYPEFIPTFPSQDVANNHLFSKTEIDIDREETHFEFKLTFPSQDVAKKQLFDESEIDIGREETYPEEKRNKCFCLFNLY